jgi:4a-hydroxytetrahydrobiopterin dehydratase
MSEQPISPNKFREADGVSDWRIAAASVMAFYRTDSYAQGLEVARAVGTVTDRADIDIRGPGVTVRLTADLEHGFDRGHVDLAQRISAAVRELGVTADPAQVQQAQVTIDTTDTTRIRPFWAAVLNYREVGEEDVLDPLGYNMPIWFQEVRELVPDRGRLHIDVMVPYDQVRPRVEAALAAGGRIAEDKFVPMSWTLADPDGNLADVTSIEDRD